jgi:hypothetical protein
LCIHPVSSWCSKHSLSTHQNELQNCLKMYTYHIRLEYKRKDKSKSTLPKRNYFPYTQTDNMFPYLTLECLDTGKIHVLVVVSGAIMAIWNVWKIQRPIKQWEVKVCTSIQSETKSLGIQTKDFWSQFQNDQVLGGHRYDCVGGTTGFLQF